MEPGGVGTQIICSVWLARWRWLWQWPPQGRRHCRGIRSAGWPARWYPEWSAVRL